MRALLAGALLAVWPACAAAQDQQVGARAKALGGSYTAFEDDPVSVWLNPAATATQPSGMAIAYQTYTIYEFELDLNGFQGISGDLGWTDPALIPTYLGFVFQVGTPETPQAIGLCFATPFRQKLVFFDFNTSGLGVLDQTFYRFRASYAIDWKLKATPEGWFTHLSAGLGLDLSITPWNYTSEPNIASVPAEQTDISFTDLGVGGGLGILLGVYDNTRDLKVNFGAAWQSSSNFNFSVSNELAPIADWPEQINAGLTVYLMEGLKLRVTLDAQWIRWDAATADSAVPGLDSYEDVFNYSAGAEYRIPASERITLFPRLGLRLYDAPWNDKDSLPAIALSPLFIETGDEKFVITSGGLGVSWSAEGGRTHRVDVSFDYGGDAAGFAVSYTTEF